MTSTAEHEPERLSPGAARWLLGVAYLVLASLYAWQASQRVSPSIFSDEIEFTQISRGIAETGMPSRLGEPSGFGSLYTYLVAPAWWLDPTDAWEAAKLIGALVMTATIFPAYGLARFVVSRPWAVAAAIGAVAAPPLAYAPYLLEEPLAYPFSTTALWAITAAVARPTRRRLVLAGVALPRRPVRPRRARGAAGGLRRRALRAALAHRSLHALALGVERRRLGRRGDARRRRRDRLQRRCGPQIRRVVRRNGLREAPPRRPRASGRWRR